MVAIPGLFLLLHDAFQLHEYRQWLPRYLQQRAWIASSGSFIVSRVNGSNALALQSISWISSQLLLQGNCSG